MKTTHKSSYFLVESADLKSARWHEAKSRSRSFKRVGGEWDEAFPPVPALIKVCLKVNDGRPSSMHTKCDL